MQDNNTEAKAKEYITKNIELIDQKKYYEFGQKIKLISHRKIQSKRYEEAQKILENALEYLSSIKEVQDNICQELLQNLIDLLKDHKDLINEQNQKRLISIMKIRGITNNQILMLNKLLKCLIRPSNALILAHQILRYRVSNQLYAQSQRIAADLDSESALNFVQRWCSCPHIKTHQIPAIYSRMALCRAITFDLNEGRSFLLKAPEKYDQDPYIKFAKMLIQASKIASVQAYDLIQKSYEFFLDEDFVFKGIYTSFGIKYFGRKAESSGILGIFNS